MTKAFKWLAKFFQTDDSSVFNGKRKFFKRMAKALKQLANTKMFINFRIEVPKFQTFNY